MQGGFLRRFLILISLIALLFLPCLAKAQTSEEILSFDTNITINTDSTINVQEEIRYYFPTQKHGIYRDIPERYLDKEQNKYFQTPISDIQITNENNQPYQYSTSHRNDELELKIGDPDRTISGEHTYKISYKVSGVLNYFSDHDELYWNVTGSDWTVLIENVSAVVNLPSSVDQTKIQTQCYTGPTGSTQSNCQHYSAQNTATFESQTGPLTIVVGWPKGVVSVMDRQYETASQAELPKLTASIILGLILGILIIPIIVLVIMLIQYFRLGRDPLGRGTIAPEFAPPENLRPAEIGTLIDEKAGNTEITATLIDLAVRGYLKIKEEHKKYTLIKLKDANSELQDYEKEILTTIFADGQEVKVSDLYENFTNLKEIKNLLYEDLVKRKYFRGNPNKIRSCYYAIGIGLILLGIFAFMPMFFLTYGTLVCASTLSGIIFLIFAPFMPRKTKEGVIVKEKSLGFKEFLFRAERYRLKWQEKEGIFEKYLPYAMIFGIAEVWAKNFKDLYKNPPSWYEGDFTTFNAVVFASSLNSFSNTAVHSFSPPAASGSSGFGGGGSSGGGFGGGGGGSW